MSYTIASIIPRILAGLNDQSQQLYTNAVLLPFIQDAGDELQGEFELNGILDLETTTSTPITIPIYTNFPITGAPLVLGYNTVPALPADLDEPQRIEERLSGSTDLFIPMVRRQWVPNILPSDSLRYWSWLSDSVQFVGSTNQQDIRIYYLKKLIVVADVNSVITVNNSQLYMINKTVELVANDIGENPQRAQIAKSRADAQLDWLLGIGVKSKQGARTRRRPYVIAGRRRWI